MLETVALAEPEVAVPAERTDAIDALSEDAGRRLIEQAFHYWEQTVHDLQRDLKELRGRIDQLERMHEDPQPVKLTLSEDAQPQLQQEGRLSRADRHRKSRWF
ncbi:hypothetical protein [Cohnella yongneupensis]|uniref:Uncharacterized protein n=1 Tax=Cohnella yongneupensis TaxID=425006 RepID=A0ABW0QZ07_9BACL